MERGWLPTLSIAILLLAAGCLGEGPSDADPGAQPRAGDLQGSAANWTALPEAPTPRTEVASVILDGELYVLGGFEANNRVSGAVEALDLATGQWSAKAQMPVPLHHAPAVVHEGQIHVLGGHAGIPFLPQQVHLVYDPLEDAWSTSDMLPRSRGAHGAAVLDGKAYLVGGVGDQGLLAAVDVYDFADGAWTTAEDLPTTREHLAVTASEAGIHAVGGRKGGLDTNLATHEILVPGQGWQTAEAMPTARGGIGGATVNGTVVVAGGEAPDRTFAEVEAWDPASGTWTSLPPMPTPRHGLGVTAGNGALYTAAGGLDPGLTVSGAVEVLATGYAGVGNASG